MASYSENGSTLSAISLRFALELGMSNAVDRLVCKSTQRARTSEETGAEERELYRIARVWFGVCNLEMFFSLDGGKLPGITLDTSPRRVRALLNHPEKTLVDIRLLSQVELNIIRTNAYIDMANQRSSPIVPNSESILRSTVRTTNLELALWLDEWTGIISNDPLPYEKSLALLNLHIQYEWALITLHLKALSDSGVENLAIMNDFQRDMVCTAKDAAVRHLKNLLRASSSPSSPIISPNDNTPDQAQPDRPSAYLTTFKWTMDYVWAKCAYSVLLVLKLALLLREPPSDLMLLLRDAHKVLEELKKITVGHISYFQILQTSIEKCENALKEYMSAQQPNAIPNELGNDDLLEDGAAIGVEDHRSAESDFQGYAPSEFVFEWDFPGLNLRHMPLSWQDLFIDLDNVF
ncbi:uncharacterized protein BDR25DRAFT_338940 [Lindgomyces ingoldianus]|uniref:Uncharacterized protein n=1 Tax=Lindgomyces ingoldianus TaxID=673940 RepID=A0ACB6RGX6_9PLEO|nr:uncharacterized protein BDR25DRAFT_338940 [Lindgomyces ingoldianus]KAF2478382.1 hypothetical protein BDR25DRAFT_338940 [Lindgomyces ingoldianus]